MQTVNFVLNIRLKKNYFYKCIPIFNSEYVSFYFFQVWRNIEALIVSTGGSTLELHCSILSEAAELVLEGYMQVPDVLYVALKCPEDVLLNSYGDYSLATP